jgi:hypothetical protein
MAGMGDGVFLGNAMLRIAGAQALVMRDLRDPRDEEEAAVAGH